MPIILDVVCLRGTAQGHGLFIHPFISCGQKGRDAERSIDDELSHQWAMVDSATQIRAVWLSSVTTLVLSGIYSHRYKLRVGCDQ